MQHAMPQNLAEFSNAGFAGAAQKLQQAQVKKSIQEVANVESGSHLAVLPS